MLKENYLPAAIIIGSGITSTGTLALCSLSTIPNEGRRLPPVPRVLCAPGIKLRLMSSIALLLSSGL